MTSVNGRLKRWTRILYVLAIEKKPLNAYQVWNKLVREEAATQPTIRSDLEEMAGKKRVKTVETDQKARGGRPSDYYDLTLFGLSALVSQFKDLEGTKMDPQQFAAHIAEKYRQLLPEVFDLWPEFIKEKIDASAWLFLTYSTLGWEWETKFTLTIGHRFFETITTALLRPEYQDHDVWLQVVGRNRIIASTLYNWTMEKWHRNIEDVTKILLTLPVDAVSVNPALVKGTLERLSAAMRRLTEIFEAETQATEQAIDKTKTQG